MKANARFLQLATMLLCLFSAVAQASLTLKQYQHTAWSSQDGAPTEISALAQTSDGMLWIGTTTGLVRFDGLKFHRWEPSPDGPQMRSRNISALLSDVNGDLWIGYRFGGISLLREGRLTNYTEENGLPPDDVQQLALDRRSTLWAVGGNRLMHLEGSQWIDRSSSLYTAGVRQPVQRFLFDQEGCLWAAVFDHIVIRQLGQHSCPATRQAVGYATGLLQAPSGEVWLSDYWNRPTPIPYTGVFSPRTNRGSSQQGSNGLLFASDGALWVATVKHGVERRVFVHEGAAPPDDHFTGADGLTSSETSSLLEDREGNVWVGTSRGLDRFNVPKFVAPLGGALHGPPALALNNDGGVWIADPYFKLFSSQQDHMRVRPFGKGGYALYAGSHDTLWVAAPQSILRYQQGRITRYPVPRELADLVVQGMVEDGEGDLLVSFTYSGVWRLSQGRWTRGVPVPGLPKVTPLSMMVDRERRVWFGYVDNSAMLWDGDRVVPVPILADLGQLLVFYQDNGHIWAGGSNGLAFFDKGCFHRIALADPGGLRGVSGIVRSRSGDLWLNGASGIIRVPAQEVDRAISNPNHRIDAEFFDYRDGVDGHAPQLRPIPSAVADGGGRLWFATSSGVLFADADHLPRNTVPPILSLQAITADGRHIDPGASLTLGVRPHKVEVSFIGLNLASPDRVRYRYQLEHEDIGWQDGGTERVASYTNLPPGTYRFLLRAQNSDGVWSPALIVSTFSIPSALTQTRVFFAGCIMTSLALLGLIYALRMRYVTARVQERMRERVTERLRIARDMHDTLLQGMQGLILRLHFTANQMPERDSTRDMLMSILDRADSVLEESRDSLLQLRSDPATRADLADSLVALAAQLRGNSGVAFTLRVDGQRRPVHPLVHEEISFIFREAFTNSLQHSGADTMTAELFFGSEELRLRFTDNGSGIVPLPFNSRRRQGHWGVQGMRERAVRIGATFEICGAPHAGTVVELRVSGGSAYLPDRSRPQWLTYMLTLTKGMFFNTQT